MCLADLLLLEARCRRGLRRADSLTCRGRWDEGSRAPRGPDNGGAQHGDELSGESRKIRKGKEKRPRRGSRRCQWVMVMET